MYKLMLEMQILDPNDNDLPTLKQFIKHLSDAVEEICVEEELLLERLECEIFKILEPEEETEMETEENNAYNWDTLVKSTYTIKYDAVENIVRIKGSPADFTPAFLDYLLEYKEIPRSAKRVFY